MNGPCDAVGNYVLFATGASNLIRQWYRSNSSGRITCQPNSQEKLKQHVLKNPPSTDIKTRSATTVINIGQLKTVKIKGRLYSVDPAIYPAVQESLQTDPVTTACELQERIEQIRTLFNVLPPIEVRLAKVGLSNYTKRYTYLSSGSKTIEIKSKVIAAANRVFDTPLQTEKYAKNVIVYSPVYLDYRPITQTAQWTDDFVPASNEYLPLFPGKTFSFDKAQFVRVAKNNGCSYTGDVTQLFPGGSASLFGVQVLTKNAIENYFKNKDETFVPLKCKLTPTSNASNGGVLLPKVGMMVKILRPGLAVELIFVPAETELDMIQDLSWPVGIGLTFSAI